MGSTLDFVEKLLFEENIHINVININILHNASIKGPLE